MWHHTVRYFCIWMFIPINIILLVSLSRSLALALFTRLSVGHSHSPLPSYIQATKSLCSFGWFQETPEGEVWADFIAGGQTVFVSLWGRQTRLFPSFSFLAPVSACRLAQSTMDSTLDRLDAAGFLQIWQHFDINGKKTSFLIYLKISGIQTI